MVTDTAVVDTGQPVQGAHIAVGNKLLSKIDSVNGAVKSGLPERQGNVAANAGAVTDFFNYKDMLALDFLSLEGWGCPFSLVWTAKTASSNSSHATLL